LLTHHELSQEALRPGRPHGPQPVERPRQPRREPPAHQQADRRTEVVGLDGCTVTCVHPEKGRAAVVFDPRG